MLHRSFLKADIDHLSCILISRTATLRDKDETARMVVAPVDT